MNRTTLHHFDWWIIHWIYRKTNLLKKKETNPPFFLIQSISLILQIKNSVFTWFGCGEQKTNDCYFTHQLLPEHNRKADDNKRSFNDSDGSIWHKYRCCQWDVDSESTIDLFNRMCTFWNHKTKFPLKYVGDLCAIFLNLYDFDILHSHTAVYVSTTITRMLE